MQVHDRGVVLTGTARGVGPMTAGMTGQARFVDSLEA
ncbi:hypothetical protein J2853_009443 [Streptosporangium lutulentum]|uniref:Uncharacterized protein n=1 Tax=Streptosporangium lutulentum TaxID=1461250 RepID=A0ABT9QTY3_9ACTN|nr:hypothetical protein [Streptosporangium lutulentum]